MPQKEKKSSKLPCRECGLPLGDFYISHNGTDRDASHYWKGTVKDGCMRALRLEVIRLREQVDYLTDLVESPNYGEATNVS